MTPNRSIRVLPLYLSYIRSCKQGISGLESVTVVNKGVIQRPVLRELMNFDCQRPFFICPLSVTNKEETMYTLLFLIVLTIVLAWLDER